MNITKVTNFFLIVESAFLNLMRKFRETETASREFPRALNLRVLVQQPMELSMKKFSDKK